MAYGSSLHKWIYDRAPTSVRTLIASAYGVQQRRRRFGAAFGRHCELLSRSQYWDTEQLTVFQQERLRAFLREALPHTPYYAERAPYVEAARSGSLDGVPRLAKRTVRDATSAFVSRRAPDLRPQTVHTSGTTGQSLIFPVSGDCFQREYAFREIHYGWGGLSLLDRQRFAFCGGHPVASPEQRKPPFWVRDIASDPLFMSSYHLTPDNLPAYVRALEAFQPVMIGGYPSSVYLLALAYRRHGQAALAPRAVYTYAETLLDFQVEAIEQAFGCRVFNWYGNTEMCANIVACEAGSLHMKLEHSFVEVLSNDDRPCAGGETGRLVCTGFGNPAFPLVRYDIGDTVELATQSHCECERGGVLVSRVSGRREDYVVTPDGRLVGRLDHIFKDSRNVIEAQVVQERVEDVVLRIVADAAYGPEDEAALLREARLRLGPAVGIEVERVDAIARGRNGKFRFIVSKLDQEQALAAVTQ